MSSLLLDNSPGCPTVEEFVPSSDPWKPTSSSSCVLTDGANTSVILMAGSRACASSTKYNTFSSMSHDSTKRHKANLQDKLRYKLEI
eukprot:34837-Amphidinium_carterae.1